MHSDISILPDFRPLPDDEFTRSLIKKLQMYDYPLPITLEGGMRLLYGFEEEFAGDIPDDLPLSVYSHASQCVVSLASFRGGIRVFACTGVFIKCHGNTGRILTSASLVRTSDDANEIDYSLEEIKVCLPNNHSIKGTLQHYNLDCNVAVVSIRDFYCRHIAEYKAEVQVRPYMELVVAIGRVFKTGKFMATNGVVTRRRSKLYTDLKVSTCKITKAGIGGPLISFHGNFIGMNFFDTEQTPYLPADRILMLLREFDEKGSVADDATNHPNPNRWPLPKPIWHYPSSVVRYYETRRRKQ